MGWLVEGDVGEEGVEGFGVGCGEEIAIACLADGERHVGEEDARDFVHISTFFCKGNIYNKVEQGHVEGGEARQQNCRERWLFWGLAARLRGAVAFFGWG